MRWDERERGQWDEGNGFNKPHDSPTHFSTSFPQFHFTPLHSIWIIRKTKFSNSWKKIYWAFRWLHISSQTQFPRNCLTNWLNELWWVFPFPCKSPKLYLKLHTFDCGVFVGFWPIMKGCWICYYHSVERLAKLIWQCYLFAQPPQVALLIYRLSLSVKSWFSD